MNRLAGRIDSSDGEDLENPSRRLARKSFVLAVGLLGILAVHHPMIFSGFRRIQTELGDSRLLNYLLEHGWLWLHRAPGHERFWNAPFFHPVQNVIAYTDSMFSYGPFYWPFRLAGFSPEVAFGLFLIASTALNYATGVLLFRSGLGFGAPATAAAAGLIAFGSPRVNQMMHAQLVPFFYLLLALYLLCRIVREGAAGALERAACWVAFALAVAAQLYGGVYLGWFFCVGLAAATATALVLRTSRDEVVTLIRRDWWAAALGAGVGAIVMIPFLAHYLPAAQEFGTTFNEVQSQGHPTWQSWWDLGPDNWVWGWVSRYWPTESHLFPWEMRLGIGYVTSAACLVGLYLGRRSPLGWLALVTTALGVAGMTLMPHERVVCLAGALASYGLGCLFREPDWSERGAGALVLTTAILFLCPPFNDLIRSLTLTLMVFCWVRLWARRVRSDGLIAPGAVLILLSLYMIPWSTMSLIAPVAVVAATILGYFQTARRIEIGILAIGFFLVATTWLSFESRPVILRDALLAAMFGWASSLHPRWRIDPAWLVRVLPAALAIIYVMAGTNSLWYALSPYVPGAQAIRMPSRVVFILLVPAAFGLATLVDRIDTSRWRIAAWCLAPLCLLEQVQTTDTYVLNESRARISAISSQIDPTFESFYYRPELDREKGFVLYNLDAMWASLKTGVPTINGNSGCFPKDWRLFPQADAPDKPSTELVLRAWCAKNGLDRRFVQRIGRQAGADEVDLPVSEPAQ